MFYPSQLFVQKNQVKTHFKIQLELWAENWHLKLSCMKGYTCAIPSAHRLIMALGDKELNAKSSVGKAAQLLSHLVPNLSHSLHHKALLIIRSDTFDYSVYLL